MNCQPPNITRHVKIGDFKSNTHCIFVNALNAMSELYNKSLQFLPQKLFSLFALIILFNLNDEVENRDGKVYSTFKN